MKGLLPGFMRIVLLILGILLLLMGLFPLLQHGIHYGRLTEFGRGFVWGKAGLVLMGLLLIFFSRRMGGRRRE